MEKIKRILRNNQVMKIIIVIAGIIALGGLFMTYESSIGEFREELKANPDDTYLPEVDFDNKDAIEISIIENFKVYNYTMNNVQETFIHGTSFNLNLLIRSLYFKGFF